MEVTRVSLTFTTLQGGTECGNEPLEFNDSEVQEGSIEHRGGGGGEQGCNQHEHHPCAPPPPPYAQWTLPVLHHH